MTRRHITIGFVCVFTAAAAVASAQPPAGGGGGFGGRARQGGPSGPGGPGGPGGPPPGVPGDVYRLVGAPGDGGGPPVTGAPYSAEGVNTVSQTLADGTRIERTTRTKLYRDSEGRTRREQTIIGIAPLNTTGEAQIITIFDPVSRVSYMIDPANRSARRTNLPGFATVRARGGMPPPPPLPPPGSGDVGAGAPPPPPPPPGGVMAGGRGGRGGGGTPPKEEPLGTRQMEGLTVTGRRMTMTIATGQIGNDRPIEVTDEVWESPELKLLVMSKHHDPRTGDSEYRLTNVSRTEQPRDLFQPPSDYTVTDAPPPGGGRGRGQQQ